MDVSTALQKLSGLLPLAGRQAALPTPLAQLHRAVLRSFVDSERPLTRAQIKQQWPDLDVDSALTRLANDDLIVLAADSQEINGAYPLTLEETPHQVRLNGRTLRAMCAVDALAVSPLFDCQTQVQSTCRITDRPITVHQDGKTVSAVEPSESIQVGIHWQQPQNCAAHSLCREMVFLVDAAAAEQWQAEAPRERTCFSLPQAIELGAAFFTPLL